MIENREVMARNIQRLMDNKQVKAADVCKTLDIKQNTFSDWMNAKTYPRIDKIELMARYFGVKKSELVEEPSAEYTLTDNEKVLIDLYRSDAGFKQLLRLSRYAELIGGIKNED